MTPDVQRLLLAISFALALSLAGCRMPAGMNDTCDWPTGATNLSKPPDLADLVEEVRVAEELAMRYADARYDSRAAHGRYRSECEARLFGTIARNHAVTLETVANAREELAKNAWDPTVHLPLAAFYVTAAIFLARAVRRRFPPDEKPAAILAAVLGGMALGLVLMVFGHLWDGAVEMIRVGDMHMSYRVERLGWRERGNLVFATSVLVFWCLVIVSYRWTRQTEQHQ